MFIRYYELRYSIQHVYLDYITRTSEYLPNVTISHISMPKLHTSDFGVKTLK